MTVKDIEKSYGVCGLVCALCSYRSNCAGCRGKDGDCEIKTCCRSKGLPYCYECGEWPCEKKMHKNIRTRAFNSAAKTEGLGKLAEYLHKNLDRGVFYHKPGALTGDYDHYTTEQEVIKLLKSGRPDPYEKCPEFETARFIFRQVREEDAEELLRAFYGDLTGWMFYGNDMCKSIFAGRYATSEEMGRCIRSWLAAYKNRYYIRLTVIDKQTEKAIGTIEIFDHIHSEKNWKSDVVRQSFVLHIDFAVPYETQKYLSELLTLADQKFFRLFGFEYLLIRAVPAATERIAALTATGYEPFFWEPGREHYYMKRRPL